MNTINTQRHLDVFSNVAFGDRRIDVIGAGATGSRIAVSLAKLGVNNIHVWDFDKVEAHNIANQAYAICDIGRFKVDALHDLVRAQTGLTLNVHNEKVDGTQILGDVVFLLTDTMSSRRLIWDNSIRFKMRTKLMIETRMGADQGRCYTVCPIRPSHVKGWEETLYNDDNGQLSACNSPISVGPTAEYLAGLAVWQLIRWFAIENAADQTTGDSLDHEIVFGLRPFFHGTRSFD